MRGFDGGGEAIASRIFQLLGELDDQNRVLGGKADQHDESDLGENIIVLSPQRDADDRGNQAHRHDHDDRQRQRQTLELCRQHQEHEDHRQNEGENGRIARPQLLEGQRGPFVNPSGNVSAASFSMISIAWPWL